MTRDRLTGRLCGHRGYQCFGSKIKRRSALAAGRPSRAGNSLDAGAVQSPWIPRNSQTYARVIQTAFARPACAHSPRTATQLLRIPRRPQGSRSIPLAVLARYAQNDCRYIGSCRHLGSKRYAVYGKDLQYSVNKSFIYICIVSFGGNGR